MKNIFSLILILCLSQSAFGTAYIVPKNSDLEPQQMIAEYNPELDRMFFKYCSSANPQSCQDWGPEEGVAAAVIQDWIDQNQGWWEFQRRIAPFLPAIVGILSFAIVLAAPAAIPAVGAMGGTTLVHAQWMASTMGSALGDSLGNSVTSSEIERAASSTNENIMAITIDNTRIGNGGTSFVEFALKFEEKMNWLYHSWSCHQVNVVIPQVDHDRCQRKIEGNRNALRNSNARIPTLNSL